MTERDFDEIRTGWVGVIVVLVIKISPNRIEQFLSIMCSFNLTWVDLRNS